MSLHCTENPITIIHNYIYMYKYIIDQHRLLGRIWGMI